MTTITITHTHTAPDGMQKTYTQEFTREVDAHGATYYWQLVDGKPGSWGYCGFADDEAFKASIIDSMHKQGECAYRAREDGRARAALCEKFDALLPVWHNALDGLLEQDAIVAALRAACEWHGALPALEELVTRESPKMLRATLRNAYKAARANVREEYADEYRDEEDKDDFYADHADDIAEALAGEL